MKYRRVAALALVCSLTAGSLSMPVWAANLDQNDQRAEAQAELAAVTVDVDKANIMFSPADNGVGANFTKVQQYQEQYLAGRQSFQNGEYSEALRHLRKADKIIRSQPDWKESD